MSETLAATRSVGPFDGWLKNAIIQIKYQGEWARVEPLARPVADAIGDITPCDAIVPVPLHPTRFRERGFNQSLLLARYVAQYLGLGVMEAIVRSRYTTAQATLSAENRLLNVVGAFAMHPLADVGGLSLILMDDVFTTGATLGACAEVLRKAGAISVSAATLAREL